MTADHEQRPIRKSDLAQMNTWNVSDFWMVDPSLQDDIVAMHGRIGQIRLRQGLFLHSADVTETQDLRFESVHSAGITCAMFVCGGADVAIGDRQLSFGSHASSRRPGDIEGVVFARARADSFVRRTTRGEKVRKVTVTVTPEWLESGGLAEIGEQALIGGFARRHTDTMTWRPSAGLLRTVEQVLRPAPLNAALMPLYLESRAIEIIAEAFQVITRQGSPDERRRIGARDRQRLDRVMDYIAAHIDAPIELAGLAREAGLSVNTLQRLFRASHDTTVLDYVRRLKLERARDALRADGISVAEAAFLAGYSNPANFVTAFKRAFGTTPGALRWQI